MDHASEAEDLIYQLIVLQGARQPPLPSTRQLFRIGGLLFRITPKNEGRDSDLFLAFQHLVESLPEYHWKYVFETLQNAAHRLVSTSSLSTDEHLLAATKALHGLLTSAPKICQLAYSNDWISTLSAIYDRFVVLDASHQSKNVLLATLSSLLLDGLFLPNRRQERSSSLEEELLGAIKAMEEQSIDCLGDLQEWQTTTEPFQRTIESQVRQHLSHNDEQRDYILNMLASARRQESSELNPLASDRLSNNKKKEKSSAVVSKPVSSADELERRVQQIKQILPEFGEGFIETALSLHQGNVETTVATLLNDPSSYPLALRVMDRTLPRRRKDRAADEIQDAAKARQLVKERVAVEEKQEQARYKALEYMAEKEQPSRDTIRSEYADDYDDQYDDIDDAKLGGADDGQYDFEQVKLYNRLVRSEEAEDSFWQETANTNRMPKNKEGEQGENGRGPEQKSWGRDKIKGGRVIGSDGKIDRKPGGQRGKKNKDGPGGPTPPKPAGLDEASKNSNTNSEVIGGGPNSKGKPRTKPKSQNRVARQRDKKQKAQGTFGAPP